MPIDDFPKPKYETVEKKRLHRRFDENKGQYVYVFTRIATKRMVFEMPPVVTESTLAGEAWARRTAKEHGIEIEESDD